MKIQGWVLAGLFAFGFFYGCSGDLPSPSPQSNVPLPFPSSAGLLPEMMEVAGSAEFGNQCPFGSYVPPMPVPLELWNCPLHLPKVELSEPLPSLILQADCKKKTLDVRSSDRAISANTWEVMPDGNFYFTFNAGLAKLKDDGAGHLNCGTPMVAYMWGRIDCKDRDKAIIHVETVWRLGVMLERPQNTASPSPSDSPSSEPSMSPSPLPSAFPSLVPTPVHTRSHSDFSRPVMVGPNAIDPSSPPSPTVPSSACQVPSGCYFHNITSIDQCS